MKALTRFAGLLACACLLWSAEPYHKPSKVVLDLLNAPPTPTLNVSPNHAYAIQGSPVRYPPISELSAPMYRLAGIRINPATNGLHNVTFNTSLKLVKVPEGTEVPLAVPAGARLSTARWSPDGSHFAFTNTTANAIEVWVGETATGRVHKVPGLKLNEVLGAAAGGRGGAAAGGALQWMPDGKSLLVHAVRANRGVEPPEPKVPLGPHVQESLGVGRGARTFEDMLQTPHDEDLFEYYGIAQLAIADMTTGELSRIGKPAIVESARVSPDGKYFIVTTIHRPFSYSYPARQFPKEIEVWDRTGAVLKKVQSLPLGGGGRGAGAGALTDDEESQPANGPRNLQWRPLEPSTLVWIEGTGGPARGGRNGGANAAPATPAHDKVFAQKAPFNSAASVIFEMDKRLPGLLFTQKANLAIIDAGGGRGGAGGGAPGANGRTPQAALLIDFDHPRAEPKKLWTRTPNSRYTDPGRPLEETTPDGERVVKLDGDAIFLSGTGASAAGDHPFLNRYNLATGETKPLFKCDDDHYEVVDALLDAHGDRLLTRRESPTEPPNYYVRAGGASLKAITHFADPQPLMRKVSKQLVTYKREDGVDMSFVLYLPPDYKPGTRLPTVVWAYPREFEDASSAGEVSGSTKMFTTVGGYSEIFFALEGYAVLDNASMPIVGDRRTVNDHFVEQVVMDAKAAIDKAVELGVTDPARVGVGGHSYGAFMTDNLLAHCNFFKAGIAESGAPNRTLTPFGFQNERRTIWQAQETYLKMSPFMYADKIKTPLLLIHGEMDDNDGTFPIQSERMYEAVRGNGGTVRLVFLPYEAHGYRAKETVEDVLWEKFQWFDKYVKNATPAPATTAEQR